MANETNMQIEIDEKKETFTLIGKIDPVLSQSGKSVLLASTRGTAKTDAKYKGHVVSLNVNVTIPNPDSAPKAEKPAPTKVKV